MARNIITTILLSFILFGTVQAQGIKQQQTMQRQQQERKAKEEKERKEREAQERAKKEKGKLKYNDLMTLVNIQDPDSINTYLTKKGWKFNTAGSDYYNWSFGKEAYGERANAFFTVWLRKGIKNRIVYQVNNHDLELKESIRKDFLSHGFKKENSSVLVSSVDFESVYRDEKYELRFVKDYDDVYFVFLENFKEIMALKNKMYECLLQADGEEVAQNYQEAMNWYKKALKLQESVDFLTDETGFVYQKIEALKRKIKEQKELSDFLQKRKSTIYEYEEVMKIDYVSMKNDFDKGCEEILASSNETIENCIVLASFFIDTVGKKDIQVKVEGKISDATKKRLVDLFGNWQLVQPYVKGYTVSASTIFRYTLENNSGMIVLKKTRNGIETISSNNLQILDKKPDQILPYDYPYGKFQYNFQVENINGKKNENLQLVHYNGYGTGANAFLSLLVPGLGDHRVSYGEKTGVKTALFTYGFLGAGALCKIASEKQYDLYHNATLQNQMNEYYEKANRLNKCFYGCVTVGATIWLSDFFWVWAKGHKNKLEQKQFKSQHLSAFYMPIYSTPVVNYTLNF